MFTNSDLTGINKKCHIISKVTLTLQELQMVN